MAGAAIDKTRRATDAADSTVQSQLDRAEAHVDDPKSFAAQAQEGAAHLLESAKDGATYVAGSVAGGATYVAGAVAAAAEGAANLASAAYEKVATVVDSAIHPDHAAAPPVVGEGEYYKKEEVKVTKQH